ncbi:MAG: C39 family peptidase [Candidatus Cloacimonetes bacterium]|jgi:hypothetical protein|nr:C39 family peptidase [Candidatus Cloacimonadota bacterium]MDD2489742.1 C39 family peptidase [Bacilli bacterium]
MYRTIGRVAIAVLLCAVLVIGGWLIFNRFHINPKLEKPAPAQAKEIDLDASLPRESIPTIKLDVKFKAQVPPGEWKHTSNCVPASTAMLYSHYKGIAPTKEMIQEFDDWAEMTKGKPINGYSGNKVGYSDTEAKEFLKLKGVEPLHNGNGNLPILVDYLRLGKPIMVTVKRKMNPEIKTFHAMVVVGISPDYIFLHDPGRAQGNNNRYPLELFLRIWRMGKNRMFCI